MQQVEWFITKHASERLSERLRAKPHKHMRMAQKAWACKDKSKFTAKMLEYQLQFHKGQKFIHYRELMGYLFVFEKLPVDERTEEIRLITVY